MNARKLIGVSLHATDPHDIIEAIEQCLGTHSEDLFAACAHATGHLARRFRTDVRFLQEKIKARQLECKDPEFVSGAIVDMDMDLEDFLPRI